MIVAGIGYLLTNAIIWVVVDRGGYGSPTIFINTDDMYFGNDRLPLAEYRLQQLLAEQ